MIKITEIRKIKNNEVLNIKFYNIFLQGISNTEKSAVFSFKNGRNIESYCQNCH